MALNESQSIIQALIGMQDGQAGGGQKLAQVCLLGVRRRHCGQIFSGDSRPPARWKTHQQGFFR
jgi:hypothetical protein